jgi:hypothetical protein
MSKFKQGQFVKHLKTGDIYEILWTPVEGLRLEATDEPAYIYWLSASHHSGDGERLLVKWIRSQKEFEDGRFKLVEQEEMND